MIKFHEWLKIREGGMVADDKAEEGKSKVKNPPVRGPNSVTTYGVAGGPGGYKGGSSGSPAAPTSGGAAPAAPTAAPQ